MSDLVSRFNSLRNPCQSPHAEREAFSAVSLLPSGGRHLGKDAFGRPCLLFQVDTATPSSIVPNVSLENLRVENGLLCRIADASGATDSGNYTIIRCLSTERGLQEYFLRSMGGIIQALPDPVDADQACRIVHDLALLFQALRRPSTRSALGLWAELFVIANAEDSRAMVQAWHSEACDRYDFSLGHERIEVKASGDRTRRHHFSFDQAYPPSGVVVVVASLFLEHCTNGTSLGQLWDRVREQVSEDADLMLKLERVCMETLGGSWQSASEREYDWELALDSIQFYDVENIPKVGVDQPDGVSDIVFRSDLSHATQVDEGLGAETGILFSALLGTRQ